MINLVIRFLIFSWLLLPSLIANPPKPIQGTPRMVARQLNLGSRSVLFQITPPSGWGIGDMKATADAPSYFTLFPVKGGYGCRIDVTPFENSLQAEKSLSQLKKKFKKIKDFENGFEVSFDRAWYCCLIQGKFLVETWYSLPKKTNKASNEWIQLRKCIVVSSS